MPAPLFETQWDTVLLNDGRILSISYPGKPSFYSLFTPGTDGRYETGTWSTPKLIGNFGKLGGCLTLRKDGTVIWGGGHVQNASFLGPQSLGTHIYDPVSDSWRQDGSFGTHQENGGGAYYFPNGDVKRIPGNNMTGGFGDEAGWSATPNFRSVMASAWSNPQIWVADFSGGTIPTTSQSYGAPISGLTNNCEPLLSLEGWNHTIGEEGVSSMYVPAIDRVCVINSRTGEILPMNYNGTTRATVFDTPITKRFKLSQNNPVMIRLDSSHNGQALSTWGGNTAPTGAPIRFGFPEGFDIGKGVFGTAFGHGPTGTYVETNTTGMYALIKIAPFAPSGSLFASDVYIKVNGVTITKADDPRLPTIFGTNPDGSLRPGVYEANGFVQSPRGNDPANLAATLSNNARAWQGGIDTVYAREWGGVVSPNGWLMHCTGYGTYAWDGTTNNPVVIDDGSRSGQRLRAEGSSSMLWLPTGQLMVDNYLWTPPPSWAPPSNYKPVPTSSLSTLTQDSTVSITGTRMFGRSVGCHQGDDASWICNHPIVSLKNKTTGNVHYCRTYNWSGWSIAETASTTHSVDIPDVPGGEYELRVASAGAISDPVDVTVRATVGGGITVNQYGR